MSHACASEVKGSPGDSGRCAGDKKRCDSFLTAPLPTRILFILMTLAGLGLVIYNTMGLSFNGFVFYDAQYYYLIFAIFGTIAFLFLPERKERIPWYDYLLAAVFFSITVYFSLNGKEITLVGWLPAPPFELFLGIIFLLLNLEACRRVAGISLPIVAVVFGLFPLVAHMAPGMFQGINYPFEQVVSFYSFGANGVLGVPADVLGGIMMGFLIFAGLLLATGAGQFFLDLSYALVGKYRGGPAKVGVFSSALFGMLTGGPVTTVAATGTIYIPDMKKVGYPAHYAGGLAAVASTGGALTPPVMGIVAFVMASMLNIPYAEVVVAAVIPSVLFYFGLLIQADLFAAKVDMKGMPAEETPSVKEVLKEGWHFIFVIVFLVWGLVIMKWETSTPFYASALVILLSFFNKKTRLTPKRIVNAVKEIGKLIAVTTAVILPVGMLVGSITITGVGASFTSGVIGMGGGNVVLIMLIGVVACFIMGMAGILVAAYVFLAVTLAPALVQAADLNPLAVHLFIMYYSILSMITPPVAGCSFVSAAIAGSPAMKTSFSSMKLGIVLYFIPWFFVFNPSLVLQGTLWEGIYLFIFCLVGIYFLAAGLEGYLHRVGRVDKLERLLLITCGFLIAVPQMTTTLIGLAVMALVLLKIGLKKRRLMMAA